MRFLLLALVCTPLIAAASPLPDFPFVYVYGVATRAVAPDRATIGFNVKSYDAQAERAYKKQSEVADALLSFVEKLGVPVENVVAQPIEKTAVRREDDKGKEFEIVGYDAVRSVQIQVKDLGQFPQLIDFLYAQANIERISVSFESKDESTIRQNLTDDACRSARENAERLSKGFQKKLGSVRAISEAGFAGIGSAFGFPSDSDVGYRASVAATRNFRVIPATISFQKGVYAIFEID